MEQKKLKENKPQENLKKDEIKLQICREEAVKQNDAFRAIDTKASFLIVIISAIFSVFIALIFQQDFTRTIAVIIWHTIFFASLMFLATLVLIILTIVSRKIEFFSLNELNSKMDDDKYSFYIESLVLTYIGLVDRNFKRLELKHRFYKISTWLMIASITLLFISMIIIMSKNYLA